MNLTINYWCALLVKHVGCFWMRGSQYKEIQLNNMNNVDAKKITYWITSKENK